MKKALLLLLCLALLPALAGCGALRAGIVEVERLQLMQTMGLDPEGEALRLSLAGQGSILSGDGANITAASRALRAQASEKLLFTGHLRHILLGAETDAALLETALDYAARSPDLRLDLPVFLLREGRAEELLRELAAGGEDVSSLLDSLERQLETCWRGPLPDAGEILAGLLTRGCALVTALVPCPAAEDASRRSVAPAGYALISGDGVSWLDEGEALGVGLLDGRHGVCELTLSLAPYRPATLELEAGHSRVSPLWAEDGSLRALQIEVELEAVIREADERTPLPRLSAALEGAVSEGIRRVFAREQALGCDFLALGERAERAAPLRFRRMGRSFDDCLDALTLELRVHSLLRHANDLEAAP